MALTPEEQAQLDRLKALIATGAQETEFEGGGVRRRVETHSLRDMQDHVARLEAKKQARPRRSLVTTKKGYRP
jgi:hypothetical protein